MPIYNTICVPLDNINLITILYIMKFLFLFLQKTVPERKRKERGRLQQIQVYFLQRQPSYEKSISFFHIRWLDVPLWPHELKYFLILYTMWDIERNACNCIESFVNKNELFFSHSSKVFPWHINDLMTSQIEKLPSG